MTDDLIARLRSQRTEKGGYWPYPNLHEEAADALEAKDKRIAELEVPLCIGRRTIGIMAEEGCWCSEDGRAVVAADELFKQDPYARIAALEAVVLAVYRHMDMDGTEIDCCDLQETLIEHGVIVAYTATEPCGDCCTCAEYGPEFPMTCYRLNDDLRAARAAMEGKDG